MFKFILKVFAVAAAVAAALAALSWFDKAGTPEYIEIYSDDETRFRKRLAAYSAVFAVRRLFSAENRPARMHSSVRRGAVFLFSYERLRPSPGFPAAVYNTSAYTAPASR